MLLLRGLIVAALLLVAPLAFAQPTTAPTTAPAVSISLRAGFDRVARPGAWTPVFVRVEVPDDAVQIEKPVDLLIANPTRGAREDVVRTPVSVAPGAATFTVYLRAGSPIDWPLQVKLVDRATDRTIAEAPRERATDPLIATGFGRLVGVSGDPAIAANAVTQVVRVPNAAPGYLDAKLLPDVPIGYECIDTLVLAGVNASTFSIDQWRAIDAWVRAGGSLLIWLDVSPIDPESTLAKLLPATVGPVGLDTRGNAARALSRKPDSRPLSPGSVGGAAARTGLGRVVLLSSDPTALAFASDKQVAEQWSWLLASVGTRVAIDPTDAIVASMGFAEPKSTWVNWRTVAIGCVVAMVLLGPIDALLLWLIGRNPRTWYTTTGWALLVPAVLFAAYAPTNAPQLPSIHSVELIDEVDGQRVRRVSIAGVPSTQPIDAEAATWISSARPTTEPPGLTPRIRFDQSRTGQRPVVVSDALPTLMEERDFAAAPPMLEVKSTDDGFDIVNLSDVPLICRRISSSSSYYPIDRTIQPQESIHISLLGVRPVELSARRSPVGFEQRMGVAPRDADDAITAISRFDDAEGSFVIAEQATGETRTFVRAWLYGR